MTPPEEGEVKILQDSPRNQSHTQNITTFFLLLLYSFSGKSLKLGAFELSGRHLMHGSGE